MTYPDAHDPAAHPARPSVRPFLQSVPASVGGPSADEGTTLRPFVITAGRTGDLFPEIGLETQVSTIPGISPTARFSPEMRAIVGLCTEPHSVAEISARLRLHLGVIRILVGDLRAAGVLDVHLLDDDTPDPETIMRVIRGLRAIN